MRDKEQQEGRHGGMSRQQQRVKGDKEGREKRHKTVKRRRKVETKRGRRKMETEREWRLKRS